MDHSPPRNTAQKGVSLGVVWECRGRWAAKSRPGLQARGAFVGTNPVPSMAKSFPPPNVCIWLPQERLNQHISTPMSSGGYKTGCPRSISGALAFLALVLFNNGRLPSNLLFPKVQTCFPDEQFPAWFQAKKCTERPSWLGLLVANACAE